MVSKSAAAFESISSTVPSAATFQDGSGSGRQVRDHAQLGVRLGESIQVDALLIEQPDAPQPVIPLGFAAVRVHGGRRTSLSRDRPSIDRMPRRKQRPLGTFQQCVWRPARQM